MCVLLDPGLSHHDGRRRSVASTISINESSEESSEEEQEDEEGLNKMTMEEKTEFYRLRKRERRESRRRRRMILRRWCRTHQIDDFTGIESLINESQNKSEVTDENEIQKDGENKVNDVVSSILKGLECATDLEQKRKEYRHRYDKSNRT